jgi:hypothetical protein
VLFEDTPFFAAFELTSFAVLPSLDGVAHGGHFAECFFSGSVILKRSNGVEIEMVEEMLGVWRLKLRSLKKFGLAVNLHRTTSCARFDYDYDHDSAPRISLINSHQLRSIDLVLYGRGFLTRAP